MQRAHDLGLQATAPIDDSARWSPMADQPVIDAADMGFQIGLMDAAGITAMMTGDAPRPPGGTPSSGRIV